MFLLALEKLYTLSWEKQNDKIVQFAEYDR